MNSFAIHIFRFLVSATATLGVSAAVVAAPATQNSPAPGFDTQTVPVTTVALPPFPYLKWPSTLDETYHNETASSFDQLHVIAGRSLRTVEGRISTRHFPNDPAGLSPIASQRNYAAAIKSLGGVKVNTVMATDPQWLRQQGGNIDALLKKMRVYGHWEDTAVVGSESYDVYLVRTRQTNIWFVVTLFDDGLNTQVITLEEKAMEQTVGLVSAATLAGALQKQGHVALYLEFDTNRDVIRPESASVVNEVVKLLRAQPELRLNLEGHTDNIGDKANNQVLSLARAQAVVRGITAQKIDPARLSAVGVGSLKPLADNGTADGRAKNRRVELVRR